MTHHTSKEDRPESCESCLHRKTCKKRKDDCQAYGVYVGKMNKGVQNERQQEADRISIFGDDGTAE